LVTGLHELNKGLTKFVNSMEASAPATDEPDAATSAEVEAETEPEA
jgi:hypothetical protein